MKILLGALINRRPQVECWLRHLARIDLTDVVPSWAFILDGDEDWARRTVGAAGLPGEIIFQSAPPGQRYIREEANKEQAYQRLAAMRNCLFQLAAELEAEAYLTCDTDIIAKPEVLQRLLETGHVWVSALVRNSNVSPNIFNVAMLGDGAAAPAIRHFNAIVSQDGRWVCVDYDGKPTGNVGNAEMIGAICLYRRDFWQRVRFKGHRCGEDVGLAYEAKAAGIPGHFIPVLCEHLMYPNHVPMHKERCQLCPKS